MPKIAAQQDRLTCAALCTPSSPMLLCHWPDRAVLSALPCLPAGQQRGEKGAERFKELQEHLEAVRPAVQVSLFACLRLQSVSQHGSCSDRQQGAGNLHVW